MGKIIKINEQQLEVLTNYILESENRVNLTEENIIEEGMMDWAKMGLITLALLAGVKDLSAQDVPKDLNSDHMKAAQLVQQKIEQGDSTILSYFDAAAIEKNQENLEKLANVDNDDVQTFKTKYASTAQAKIKSGDYALAGVNVTQDTLVKHIGAPVDVISDLQLNLDGSLFVTGTYDLNPELTAEIDFVLQNISSLNGKILEIQVYSSTDAEAIPSLAGGNQELAQLRADAITKYLISQNILDIDVKVVKDAVLAPESGSNVVSKEDFKAANVALKQAKDSKNPQAIQAAQKNLDTLRGKTTQYRSNKINIKSVTTPAADESDTLGEVTQKVEFLLIKKKSGSGKQHKITGKTKTSKNNYKCDKVKGTKGGVSCAKW